MAFLGYYFKVNGVIFPGYLIAEDGYSNTPNQHTDKGDYVDGLGVLHRTILPTKRSTVKITTMDNFSYGSMVILKAFFIPRSLITAEYWNDEAGAYKTASFYVPDVEYVHHKQHDGSPVYKSITFEFIAYGGDT